MEVVTLATSLRRSLRNSSRKVYFNRNSQEKEVGAPTVSAKRTVTKRMVRLRERDGWKVPRPFTEGDRMQSRKIVLAHYPYAEALFHHADVDAELPHDR